MLLNLYADTACIYYPKALCGYGIMVYSAAAAKKRMLPSLKHNYRRKCPCHSKAVKQRRRHLIQLNAHVAKRKRCKRLCGSAGVDHRQIGNNRLWIYWNVYVKNATTKVAGNPYALNIKNSKEYASKLYIYFLNCSHRNEKCKKQLKNILSINANRRIPNNHPLAHLS